MGYRNTPAFMTRSLSRHGGDSVWPTTNTGLIIRRGNIEAPSNLPGEDLGWVESIGPLIQALTTVGSTAYTLRQQQMDEKRARTKEEDAKRAEAAAVKAAAAAAQAQITAQDAGGGLQVGGTTIPTPALVLGGAVALGALYLFLRRK